MLNKISKDIWVYKNETNPEEFDSRVSKLRMCIEGYVSENRDVSFLARDLKKININQVCLREMTELKNFINKTKANYENVYAPIDQDLKNAINKSYQS